MNLSQEGVPKLSKEKIVKHLDKYIKKWMFNDISRCIKSRANYAVAAILMSYTEIIGAMIIGKLGLRDNLKGNFNAFLEYFDFNGNLNYYKEFSIETSDDQESSFGIYDIVRCGLIHEYFLKGLGSVENDSRQDMKAEYNTSIAGVSWNNQIAGCSGYDHSGKCEQVLIFDNNAYFRDFKRAVDKIYNLIESGDEKLISNISDSLIRISKRKIYAIRNNNIIF